MKEREQNSRTRVIAIAVLAVVVLLPFLYIVAVGPVAWLITHGYLPLSPDCAFFWPCGFLSSRSTWFNAFMVWYLSCFIDLKAP